MLDLYVPDEDLFESQFTQALSSDRSTLLDTNLFFSDLSLNPNRTSISCNLFHDILLSHANPRELDTLIDEIENHLDRRTRFLCSKISDQKDYPFILKEVNSELIMARNYFRTISEGVKRWFSKSDNLPYYQKYWDLVLEQVKNFLRYIKHYEDNLIISGPFLGESPIYQSSLALICKTRRSFFSKKQTNRYRTDEKLVATAFYASGIEKIKSWPLQIITSDYDISYLADEFSIDAPWFYHNYDVVVLHYDPIKNKFEESFHSVLGYKQ